MYKEIPPISLTGLADYPGTTCNEGDRWKKEQGFLIALSHYCESLKVENEQKPNKIKNKYYELNQHTADDVQP